MAVPFKSNTPTPEENDPYCDAFAERNKELVAQCEELQRVNTELNATIEVLRSRLRYTEGLAEGLKFSIRCNGVSGGEVKE